MSAATDALEAQVLDLIFPAGRAWLSLHAADPGETVTTSPEVVGGGYARQQATVSIVANSATLASGVSWGSMPAGTVGGVGIWTEQTGGQMLAHLALAHPREVSAGDSLLISAGNLTLSVD